MPSPERYARGSGIICISYHGMAAWMMHYIGERRDERTAGCIWAACEEAYRAGDFIGGRGPHTHEHNGTLYVNDPAGDFDSFHGLERVFDPTDETGRGRLIGWCPYHGGLIV